MFDNTALWLKQAGLRPTRQRRALADLVVGGGHRHVTAETLHAEAAAAGVDVSLATVYNTLRQFTAAGLIKEIQLASACVYYDTRTDDHAHYRDEATGQVFDAPIDAQAVAQAVPAPEGYEIAGVDMVIRLRRAPCAQATCPATRSEKSE